MGIDENISESRFIIGSFVLMKDFGNRRLVLYLIICLVLFKKIKEGLDREGAFTVEQLYQL